jgi:hypothetical protein
LRAADRLRPAETRGVNERLREYARARQIADATLAAMEVQIIGSFSVSHPSTSAIVESKMSTSDPPMR